MFLTEKLGFICLILIASTDGWIFNSTICGSSTWPSSWGSEHPRTYHQVFFCNGVAEPSGNLASLVDITIKGDVAEKTYSDIEIMHIEATLSPLNYTPFTNIPSNMGKLMPKLTGVSFNFRMMSSVTAEDLKQFPNITYLVITNSRIASLDGDLFKYTPHIKALSLQGNQIESVGQNLLENLNDLQWANFLYNPCISFVAGITQELEWLKSNLTLECPPKETTTATPVENCDIRCSMNEEMDSLRDKLTKQDALIRDLSETLSHYSKRISKLEEFDAKIITAANVLRT